MECLLCDFPGCKNAAQGFGIKSSVKEKSCGEHVSRLLAKKMTVYDISGFAFSESAEDMHLFEERCDKVDCGLENLSILEEKCREEFRMAERTIEDRKAEVAGIVDRCFEEIRLQVTLKYEEVTLSLSSLCEVLKQYRSSKSSSLSPSGALLCTSVPFLPRFLRFAINDCSDSIATALMSSWRVSQEDTESTLKCIDPRHRRQFLEHMVASVHSAHSQYSFALESLEYAKELGYVNTDQSAIEESIRQQQVKAKERVEELFSATAEWSGKATHQRTSASESDRSAVGELVGEESVEELRKAWEKSKRKAGFDSTRSEVGLALSLALLRRVGSISESEQVLKAASESASLSNPLSEDSMKLKLAQIELSFSTKRYTDCESQSSWALQTFSNINHPSAHFWAALLYLSLSLGYQGRQAQAIAVVEEWQDRLAADSPLAKGIELVVMGRHVWRLGNSAEAEKLHKEALVDGTSKFVDSVYGALNYRLLADLYKEMGKRDLAQQHYELAQRAYELCAPFSVLAATNLTNAGVLYQEKGQITSAEQCYQHAQSILDIAAPLSIDSAKNLTNLGFLYQKTHQLSTAEDLYKRAKTTFDAVAPLSVDAAKNVMNLGVLYKKLKRNKEAEECYLLAQRVYQSAAPVSTLAASNFVNLGNLMRIEGRAEEAENAYKRAKGIYAKTAPQSPEAARNLQNLGALYEAMSRLTEASFYYQLARDVYTKTHAEDGKTEMNRKIAELQQSLETIRNA